MLQAMHYKSHLKFQITYFLQYAVGPVQNKYGYRYLTYLTLH